MQLFFSFFFSFLFLPEIRLPDRTNVRKNVINAKLMAGSNLIFGTKCTTCPSWRGGGGIGGAWGGGDEGTSQNCPVGRKKGSCRRCHFNMTAAPRLLTGVFAILISIDDFFVFPSAWHSVTFGRFRHTQRQRARGCKWDIDSFLRMHGEHRTGRRSFTVLPSVLVFFFFFASVREEHWPPSVTFAGITEWEDQFQRFDKPAGWPTVINLSGWQPRDMLDS